MPPLVNKADELATSLSQLQLGPQQTEPPCLVLYHAACLNHRYTRPDASESATGRQAEAHDAACVERPERLRAVLCGIHAAINRHPGRVSLQTTQASLSLASNLVKAVHGPLQVTDTSDYAHDLQSWLGNVEKQHKTGQSEIPEGYPQGDLYLAAGPDGSQTALEGALGAACQAVDQVCAEPDQGGVRFVAVRPPGHHCGRDSPSGFCFVNTVAVALQHAHESHNVDRVVILDIDLHHGNGTQSLVWDINAKAAVAAAAASKTGTPKGKGKQQQQPPPKRPLKVFYGSLHDILSFPCETGDPHVVANASVRLAAHGQHISNVHLKPYTSSSQFHSEVYPQYQHGLFGAAKEFCKDTQADPSKTLFIISAGMDACELEYTTMSRHNRRVPVSFYNRFARDVRDFASDPANFPSPPSTSTRQQNPPGRPCIPRIVSVLEGGYSDAALMSGTASLLQGLSTVPSVNWSSDPLEAKDIPLLDKACCVNPPPPMLWKKLPPWALSAGEQLCAFLNESRDAWDQAKQREAELEARAAQTGTSRTLRERRGPKKYAEDESEAKGAAGKKTRQGPPTAEGPAMVRTVKIDDMSAEAVADMLNRKQSASEHAPAPTSSYAAAAAHVAVKPESVERAPRLGVFDTDDVKPQMKPTWASAAQPSAPVSSQILQDTRKPTVEAGHPPPPSAFTAPFPSSTSQQPVRERASSHSSQHRFKITSPENAKQSADEMFMQSAAGAGGRYSQAENEVFQPIFKHMPAPSQNQQSPAEETRNPAAAGVKLTWKGAPLGN